MKQRKAAECQATGGPEAFTFGMQKGRKKLQGKRKKKGRTQHDGSLEPETGCSGAASVTGSQGLRRAESHSPLPAGALAQQLPDRWQELDSGRPACRALGPAALAQAFLDSEEL